MCRGHDKLLRSLCFLTALVLPSQASSDTWVLSSGLTVTYHDMIDEAPLWRIRFVAPALGGEAVGYLDVAEDMQGLCQTEALPRLRRAGKSPERIVVVLMSAPAEFGVMSRDVLQFFESFSIEDGRCIWEAF